MHKTTSTFNMILACCLLFAFSAKAQTTIHIDPDLDPTNTCDGKPGYKLIFSDEFDALNLDSWDVSTPGDDQYNYSEPDFCKKSKHTPPNASNVFAAGGMLNLRVREGEDMNACDFSGAEIKTFNNFPTGMQHWKMTTNSYLEARIKVAYCPGTASSFWLYGAEADTDGDGLGRFFEIDMIETGSGDDTKFTSNIHYGSSYADDHTDKRAFVVRDGDGNHVNLADQFLTFGVELTDTEIKMYLNNALYATYPFAQPNSGPLSNYLRPVPFNIRMGESATLANDSDPSVCGDLPKDMQVDYIRLYRKSGFEAVKFTNGTEKLTLCADYPWGDGNNVSVDYFPGVEYRWAPTPFFNFQINYNGLLGSNVMRWWVSVVPGTPPGDYTIPLLVTLPCGGVETKVLKIKVVSGVPAPPANIFLTEDGFGHYYPNVLVQNNTIAYEWKMATGQNWERVLNLPNNNYNTWTSHGFIADLDPRQVNICVRAVGPCGVSAQVCKTLTIPGKNGPKRERTALLPPDDVTVEPMPNTPNFRLGVRASSLADAYQWSFDQNYWYTINNSATAPNNYFGEFTAGTPSFPIYVRAKQLDTLSYVYTEQISFPAPRPATETAQISRAEALQNQLERTDIPQEEGILNQYMLFNALGQMIQSGPVTSLSQKDLQEQLTAGAYFIVRYAPGINEKKIEKLLIAK